jgi:putative endonuclease
MASLSGTLYTGITGAFFTRVREHKAGEIEGFSRQYKCNRLVYYERFEDARKAIARKSRLSAGGARRR